jgi:hypothetical protein
MDSSPAASVYRAFWITASISEVNRGGHDLEGSLTLMFSTAFACRNAYRIQKIVEIKSRLQSWHQACPALMVTPDDPCADPNAVG